MKIVLLQSIYIVGRLISAYFMLICFSKYSKRCMMSISLGALIVASIISMIVRDDVYKMSAVLFILGLMCPIDVALRYYSIEGEEVNRKAFVLVNLSILIGQIASPVLIFLEFENSLENKP